MPTIVTRGAGSARGFGFGGAAAIPYWIAAYYSASSNPNIGPVFLNNSNQIISLGQATGSSNGPLVLSSTGALVNQLSQTTLSDFPYYSAKVSFDSTNDFFYMAGPGLSNQIALAKVSASSYAFSWLRYFTTTGSPAYSLGLSCAVDASQNVYVVGQLNQTAACCNSYGYATIGKYNSSGTYQWSKLRSQSLSSADYFFDVVVSSGGSPVVVGKYLEGAGYQAGVIMSFNSAGTELWGRRLSNGTDNITFNAMTKDSSDNYYVCGYNNTLNQSFIVKYNSSGTIQWQRTINSCTAQSITIDSVGDIYIYAAGNSTTFYILKYNSSGVIQWQRQFVYQSTLLRASQIGDIKILNSESSIVLAVIAYQSSLGTGYNRLIYKYPANGSKTGTYAIGSKSVIVSASSLTDAAGSYTDAAANITNRTVAITTTSPANPTYSAASNSLSLTTI